MGCDKTKFREITAWECLLCWKQTESCDECAKSVYDITDEDWYCYSDGIKHFCDTCWAKELREKKKVKK